MSERDADGRAGGVHHVVGDDGRDRLDVGGARAARWSPPRAGAAGCRAAGPGRRGRCDSSVPSISTSAPPLVGPPSARAAVQDVRIASGLVPPASMASSPVQDPVRRTSLSTWSTAPRSGSSKSRVRASAPTRSSNGEPNRSSAVGVGIDDRAVGVERHRGNGEAVQQRGVGLPRPRDRPGGPGHSGILSRVPRRRETNRALRRVVLAWPGRVVRLDRRTDEFWPRDGSVPACALRTSPSSTTCRRSSGRRSPTRLEPATSPRRRAPVAPTGTPAG